MRGVEFIAVRVYTINVLWCLIVFCWGVWDYSALVPDGNLFFFEGGRVNVLVPDGNLFLFSEGGEFSL